jgi:predicted transcriptional regulator
MTSISDIQGATSLVASAQLTSIVCAYVSNNSVPVAELPKLIASIRDSLSNADTITAAGVAKPTPAEIKRSITHQFLISFEDGKPYKTLRRHLTIKGLTPEGYRAKWGLPPDYPMTSAAYSQTRSELATALGLGQQRRKDHVGKA